MYRIRPAFACALRASHVNEDTPHRSRCHRQEMTAILPLDLAGVRQPHECLVNERGCPKRIAAALPADVVSGLLAEFVVQNRRHAAVRVFVACMPGAKQCGHLAGV
jgi:hypothetical protein